jgi:tetratricopeptide (TPR) repeat protein
MSGDGSESKKDAASNDVESQRSERPTQDMLAAELQEGGEPSGERSRAPTQPFAPLAPPDSNFGNDDITVVGNPLPADPLGSKPTVAGSDSPRDPEPDHDQTLSDSDARVGGADDNTLDLRPSQSPPPPSHSGIPQLPEPGVEIPQAVIISEEGDQAEVAPFAAAPSDEDVEAAIATRINVEAVDDPHPEELDADQSVDLNDAPNAAPNDDNSAPPVAEVIVTPEDFVPPVAADLDVGNDSLADEISKSVDEHFVDAIDDDEGPPATLPEPSLVHAPDPPAPSPAAVEAAGKASKNPTTASLPANGPINEVGSEASVQAVPEDAGPEEVPLEAPPQAAEVAGAEVEAAPVQTAAQPAAAQPAAKLPSETVAQPATIDLLPLEEPVPSDPETWPFDYNAFRRHSQDQARMGKWRQLAAQTGHALSEAPYATGLTRNAMLLDLAQLFRDRLDDSWRAEQCYLVLSQEDAANSEALRYLEDAYCQRGDWAAVYELYFAAVEATWDPNERLRWTERCAAIASDKLNNTNEAIRAWEHLWRLGDAMDESSRALSHYYRVAGRWADLASFLRRQAEHRRGAAKVLVLRELAEVLLSGLREPDEAAAALEQIIELRATDPLAVLQLARVYAQREDWEKLLRLARDAASTETSTEALDLNRFAADALWQADRHEDAVALYQRILEEHPQDRDANQRKREYLNEAEKYAELVDMVLAETERSGDEKERAALLAEAATLAEEKLGEVDKAAKLWRKRLELNEEDLASHQALARLSEAMADLSGIAAAIEGQLALTKDLDQRVTLLKELGTHYSGRVGDDDRAEGCWKEVLALDPSDRIAREELIQIHKRRGDFESLNSALVRQIWLTDEPERIHELCRLAAQNIDQNFNDPSRSVTAWRRVLDYAPLDTEALRALATQYDALDNKRQLTDILEQELRGESDQEARIALAHRIATIWLNSEQSHVAAAAYERILRWHPTNDAAIAALVKIYSDAGETQKAIGVLEFGSAQHGETEQREALLRQCLGYLETGDTKERFFLLRRLLMLTGGSNELLTELHSAAEAGNLFCEMASVLAQLASDEENSDNREVLLSRLAQLYEAQLNDADRAFLVQQSLLFNKDISEDELQLLGRLAESTKRYEDLLALLEGLAEVSFPLDQRKDALITMATITEEKLDAPQRAFELYWRLLSIDPSDWSSLEKMEGLAEKYEFWHELDAAYCQAWDGCSEKSKRIDLLGRREVLFRSKLNRPKDAFDLRVLSFRMDSQDDDLLRQLTEDAEVLSTWNWLLPILEADQRAAEVEDSATELMVTGALYEGKLNDLDHAFDLYAAALLHNPASSDIASKLESLADAEERLEKLAATLRLAAASADDSDCTLALLRRIADVYQTKLSLPQRAIDVHRRILSLKENEMESLSIIVDWHRDREEWRDLRDRLKQWNRLVDADEEKIAKLLEIAQVSENKLTDSDGALKAYGEVLELDANNADAKKAMEGLVLSITEPSVRLRWLRMELADAPQERRDALYIEIAQLQDQELGDADGAIRTLVEFVGKSGSLGGGYEPLADLLRREEKYKAIVQLLRQRAAAMEEETDRKAALDEALDIYHQFVGDQVPDLGEELYRDVLKEDPTNRAIAVRLARLLRNSARYEDLAQQLNAQLLTETDRSERQALQHEIAIIEIHNLERPEPALKIWKSILDGDAANDQALLSLARHAYHDGDLRSYVELRELHAREQPKVDAALIFCHLAEVCEENTALNDRTVPFYRQARALDPNNEPAMEALKGIGRRLKNLRPAAALLPLDGERDLDRFARAERLRSLGDTALEQDPATAQKWYHRAAIVDSDSPDHWRNLAIVSDKLADTQAAHRARIAEMEAYERISPLDASKLPEQAGRYFQLASSAISVGEQGQYQAWARRAYELFPEHAPASLAIAESWLKDGQTKRALDSLIDTITHRRDQLSEAQLAAALFARGRAHRLLGEGEEASANFRESLQIAPLRADCLRALGELEAEQGRPAAALQRLIRALTTGTDAEQRGHLFYSIGRLWEEAYGATEDAGACYEMALAEGLELRELQLRALKHFHRIGQTDESMRMVEKLLPTAEDPDELARLWLAKGDICSDQEGKEDEAIEAYDMALSYDPSLYDARSGLIKVLERRQVWTQLLEVLEASCDVGTPAQRAGALERMAKVCGEHLNDAKRAEEYLRLSVAAKPTEEALKELIEIYREQGRDREHAAVLGDLLRFGPPWFERIVELTEMLEDNRWVWCLVSPLLGVSQIGTALKGLVQQMRKDYEKPAILLPSSENANLLQADASDAVLLPVLTEIESLVRPLGRHKLAQCGDENAVAVTRSTGLGKTFGAMAEAFGLSDAALYRSTSVEAGVTIINAEENVQIVLRTDLLQQLVHAEVGFLLSYTFFLSSPGYRTLAALSTRGRAALFSALWHCLGYKEVTDPALLSLAEALEPLVQEEWRDELAQLKDLEPKAYSETWWKRAETAARRAGLLAGADLRQIFRLLSRLEEDIERPKVVSKLAELDAYIGESAVLKDLLAFAASPRFGQLIRTATQVDTE